MARNLARLKDVLWGQFEAAVEQQDSYEDSSSSGEYTPSNFAIHGRQSIAALAQAIVAVEAEEREAGKPEIKLQKGPANG